MKRAEQHKLNQEGIARIKEIELPYRFHIPSSRSVITTLNNEGFKTSRGNAWTRRSLYRMLQREGYSGLWGIFKKNRALIETV